MSTKADKVQKTEEEWRRELTPEQYRVLREKGTERPFTGEYEYSTDTGVYRCAACGNELFDSETKYDSGCGWPAFYQPMSSESVEEHEDLSHGMRRVEVTCSRCGSHLGHVFPDGPRPTGIRFCINSVSLKHDKK
jgi:peptide-methionine (R)-S-oxide reductase